jgi:hypothetical protein
MNPMIDELKRYWFRLLCLALASVAVWFSYGYHRYAALPTVNGVLDTRTGIWIKPHVEDRSTPAPQR